jgi:ligand-binding sensor domain-containing protein
VTNIKRLSCLSVLLLLFILLATGYGSPSAKAAPPNFSVKGPETGWFFTSVCRDRAARLWCGTEDRGIVWYDPAFRHWNEACAPSSFNDVSVYSVVCDSRGEVWAGTLNHGVAGFDGEKWTYYTEADGLRGRRVFALAINPLDGSLWAATENGLSRRDPTNGLWSFLPLSVSNALVEATCLAFAADGALYVGTQCDGVLIGSAADHYATFKNINGPALMPDHPQGIGLPCGLITCLMVTADGSVWAGTSAGISCSKDKGKTWNYYCGSDWANKQAGLPGALPTAGKAAAKEIKKDTFIPSEDYVTCLAEMPAGHLWIGHREQGCDELNLATMKLEKSGSDPNNHTVYAMAMLPVGSHMVVATYGNGLLSAVSGAAANEFASEPARPQADAKTVKQSPAVSYASLTKSMNEQLAILRNVHASPDEYKPFVAPLPDDWVTEGDWLGRNLDIL